MSAFSPNLSSLKRFAAPPLAFPFFAFSPSREKAKKPTVAGKVASVCEPIEVCFKFLPCSKPSPCLIVLAHNEAKIVYRFAPSPCLIVLAHNEAKM